jgi:hypothetical protein
MKTQFLGCLLLLSVCAHAQIGIGTTTPNSTLDVRGSFSLNYRAFSSSTSASATDNTLVFTGTSAATLTLPTATTVPGRIYSIKNVSSNSSVLTIATTSSQTIDGLSSWTLSQANMALVLVSNGTDWYATSESLPGNGTGSSWLRGGNNVSSMQNIGTTSNYALPFITNNTEKMRLTTAGYLGIGTTTPSNYLEVAGTNTTTGVSGLRLTNLGTATTAAANSKVLSVNSTGDIIVTNNPAASQWLYTGNSGINPALHFLGTTDDKQMIIKSNNQSYLEFGRRQTLGLTQAFADYDDNDEKVTYVRSALQFDAPNAAFYKPKMFTDANGNFRVKGSSAGTDYFEFGSTGASNNGGFEFIIGDDGDEPILFKSYHYINGMSEIMRLQSGRMAVGSNAFNATNPEKLLIDAGVTTSYNLMTGKGSIDNYLQINVQNRSNGTSASSDLVATNDNGTETSNYIDMGINSSAYNNNAIPVLNGANNTYLYGAGNDFKIGNVGNNRSLSFFTTPDATQANATERMRILGNGNIGIANAAPSEKLDVTGNIRFSGALMPNNAAGNAGQVLVSAGAGAPPTWQDGISGTAWLQNGNTFSTTKNFGTVSNHDIPFITNNTEKMRLSTGGFLGIGTNSPAGKLHLVTESSEAANDYLFDDYSSTTTQGIFLRRARGTVASPQNLQNGDMISYFRFVPRYSNAALGFADGSGIDAYYKGNGTTGLTDLRFISSNTERMRISENGGVGIGTSTFNASNPEELIVDAGSTGNTNFQNVIVGKGNTNSYAQLNIQNGNAGTSASSDVVATSNNGNESSNFIDMGINSGSNSTTGVLGGANTAYLYSTGADLAIGNGVNSRSVNFFTTVSGNYTERMRINAAGDVCIGQTTPNGANKLTVNGSISATAFNVSSDRRLKTNIRYTSYGLKHIMNLQPVSWNWKDKSLDETPQLGLIAQDVKQLIPEIVSGNEQTGTLAINYTELVPVLINAIKEQQQQIDQLKKKVEALERR